MATSVYDPYTGDLPTLVQIEYEKSIDPTGPYSVYGWDKLVVDPANTYVVTRFNQLGVRFNQKYYFRMINAETLERAQIYLQTTFDEWANRMNRAYEIYATNDADLKAVKEGKSATDSNSKTREITGTNSNTNTVTIDDANTMLGRNVNTPDEAINTSDNYASNLLKQNGTNTGTHVNTGSGTIGNTTEDTGNGSSVTYYLGKQILENANINIESWKDIDTFFIQQFQNNFCNTFDIEY